MPLTKFLIRLFLLSLVASDSLAQETSDAVVVARIPFSVAALHEAPNTNRIYAMGSDGRIVAVSTTSQQVVQETTLSNANSFDLSEDGERLFVGRGSATFGGRGAIIALDASTLDFSDEYYFEGGVAHLRAGKSDRLYVIGLSGINFTWGISLLDTTRHWALPALGRIPSSRLWWLGDFEMSSDREDLYFSSVGASPGYVTRYPVTTDSIAQAEAIGSSVSDIGDLAVSPALNLIAQINGQGATVRVLDGGNVATVRASIDPQETANALTFSSNGQLVFSASDSVIEVHGSLAGDLKGRFNYTTTSVPVDMIPDTASNRVWVGTEDELILLELNLPEPPPVEVGVAPLANLSARGRVGVGDNVLIGGLVIGGDGQKRVLVTARGLSIPSSVAGRLADPKLTIFSGSTPIASSDDWSAESQADAIVNLPQLSGGQTHPKDAGVILNLLPGAYTAIVEGVGGTEGIGIVEIFDLEPDSSATLINLSTRGAVGTGDNVLIGGVVVGGSPGDAANLIVRGMGPSVGGGQISGVLADPTVTLYDGPTPYFTNDNWGTSATAGQLGSFTPTNGFEAASLQQLPAGVARTAILSGAGGTSGIALIEFFVAD